MFEETEEILQKIDRLVLHPRFKLQLYMKYLLPKISWHLTIADIDKTCMGTTNIRYDVSQQISCMA
jgi:hypothetical protein